jgi:hypothetical protein
VWVVVTGWHLWRWYCDRACGLGFRHNVHLGFWDPLDTLCWGILHCRPFVKRVARASTHRCRLYALQVRVGSCRARVHAMMLCCAVLLLAVII